MDNTLSIVFSQVAHSKEARKFLMTAQKASDLQIQTIGKILH
jgi:hypothetical protein